MNYGAGRDARRKFPFVNTKHDNSLDGALCSLVLGGGVCAKRRKIVEQRAVDGEDFVP